MSIYRRDDVSPEWEPIPYDMKGPAADEQELGFHQRAIKSIGWKLIPFEAFPTDGIFGHDRGWFIKNEIECYATFEGEDLLLIRNLWHGFPDPPEWGLASRPSEKVVPWSMWGHVPSLPKAWIVPSKEITQLDDYVPT